MNRAKISSNKILSVKSAEYAVIRDMVQVFIEAKVDLTGHLVIRLDDPVIKETMMLDARVECIDKLGMVLADCSILENRIIIKNYRKFNKVNFCGIFKLKDSQNA